MSGSQRATLLIVPMLLLGAFGYLIYTQNVTADVAVSWGRVFSAEEMINAEQAFMEEGLTTFRHVGGQIFVPSTDVDRYNAVLVSSDAIPTDWASTREATSMKTNFFSSNEQRKTMDEIALARELRRVLRAIPDIEDAHVIWAQSKERPRWPDTRPRVTATVSVKPRRGREVSHKLAASLRSAVASMVPDLKPADVNVLDLISGDTHPAEDESDPLNGRVLTRIQEFTRYHQRKIMEALSYIPDVIVSVNVDVDNVRSSVERIQKLDPENVVALTQNDESRTETSTNDSTSGEPGAASNTARELSTSSTSKEQFQKNASNNKTVNAPSFTVTDKEIMGAMPSAVQVSISVPHDFYQAVAAKQGLTPGATDEEKASYAAALKAIQTEMEKNVKSTVDKLIPKGSPPDAVYVASYTPVEHNLPLPEVSTIEHAGDMVRQWGGAVALALFAVWALRMLQKSIPKLPEIPAASMSAFNPANDGAQKSESAPPVELTERDRLQNVIRDNPEMAASVISKWIRTAK